MILRSIAIFLLLLLLPGCGLEKTTLQEEYEGDLQGVTKIHILDGNTGLTKEVNDEVLIRDFLTEVKEVKFIPLDDQGGRDGFNYSITLISKDEDPFSFTLTMINGHYYETETPLLPIVDEFYNSLKGKETGLE